MGSEYGCDYSSDYKYIIKHSEMEQNLDSVMNPERQGLIWCIQLNVVNIIMMTNLIMCKNSVGSAVDDFHL